ncbi:MAG: hypothetical protein ABSH49_25540 [Bryobacteraceae bacterium]
MPWLFDPRRDRRADAARVRGMDGRAGTGVRDEPPSSPGGSG